MTEKKINISKLTIVVIWILIQCGLLIKNGIVTTGEASKYIYEADYFLHNGNLSSPNYWFYAVEIFLILIDKLIGAGMILVLVVQLFFNLIVTFQLYKLVRHIIPGNAALICTILFLLNYPFHEFNTFAQTESLYYSFSLILSSYLIRLTGLNARTCFIILACLFILTITRPTGILFVIPVALYLLTRFKKNIRSSQIITTAIITIISFTVILNIALGSGGQLDFMLPFKTNQVICGIPRQTYDEIKITEKGNSIYGLFYYVSHNFSQFFSLALKKSIAFFGLTRGYFSHAHNLFLIIFYYPVYLFIIWNLKAWSAKYSYFFVYMLSVITVTWGTTILTCDDWHNRFFLSVSPYLIILAVPAITKLAQLISSGTFFRNRY